MNKLKIMNISILLMILFSTKVFATSDELDVYTKTDIVPIEQVSEYKNKIENEIEQNGVMYQLEDIKQEENKITLSQEKIIEEQKIVNTNDKYQILQLFESKKNFEENNYKGTLEIQFNNIEVKINDNYKEEYKVTLQKRYNNVASNELKNIPKTIKENGVIYYLVNPVWNVSKTEKIEGQDVPISYNGIMNYEGIKEKTIIKNYIATVKYQGILNKEDVESITFTITYKEIPKETNYVPVIATTGAGIIIFSGIIIIRRKNIYIYNLKNNQWKLVKKLHISKNQRMLDITPLTWESNKYKIVLKNKIFNELQNENITIKYFDKQFIYQIKDREFEILV